MLTTHVARAPTGTETERPVGYPARQILLHWLAAGLIVLALASGALSLAHLPNGPEKILPLRVHVSLGCVIGLALVGGRVVRWTAPQPPRMGTGRRGLDRLATVVHHVLPVVALAMVGSGLALAFQANLPAVLFGPNPAALPADFWQFPPRLVHAILAKALMLLVAIHGTGAAFHHLVRKDGGLKRMWFGGV